MKPTDRLDEIERQLLAVSCPDECKVCGNTRWLLARVRELEAEKAQVKHVTDLWLQRKEGYMPIVELAVGSVCRDVKAAYRVEAP